MINIPARIREMVNEALLQVIWIGTVTGTDGNRVNVRRPGQASADPQSYPRLASYTPTADDEVLVITVPTRTRRTTAIVVGKIVR